jgi:hypothetical protein
MKTGTSSPPPTFTIILVAGSHRDPADVRIQRLLKTAKRRDGLICRSLRESPTRFVKDAERAEARPDRR